MSISEIKGSVVKDTLVAIQGRVGTDGLERILGMLNPETRAALERPLASLWYPLDAFTELVQVDCRETAGGNEKELIARAEAVVDGQLRGIYRVFVRIGSPEFVLKRIASIHETYFRGVRVEAQVTPANEAYVRYWGLKKQNRIMENLIIGFHKKALEISGAKNVLAMMTKPIGDDGGFAELRLRWNGPRNGN